MVARWLAARVQSLRCHAAWSDASAEPTLFLEPKAEDLGSRAGFDLEDLLGGSVLRPTIVRVSGEDVAE